MENNIVIYHVKTKPYYFANWEYYQIDKKILERKYKKVLVSHSIKNSIFLLLTYPEAHIFCWWWHSSSLIILIAKILRRKVFCTGALHMFDYSSSPDFYKKNFFYRVSARISFILSDKNLFISKDQFLSISSHLKVKNPLVIYSSLDENINKYPQINEVTKYLEASSINLLFLGWLDKNQIIRKSLLETLEALSICIFKYKLDVYLTIAGKTGNALPLIKERIHKLNLKNNVIFDLDIEETKKNNLYMQSDLLITPSHMEGFGNATLEAMAFGCPSLVSRYGASPEVVGESGIIIYLINAGEISKSVLKYSELGLEKRKEMRSMAYLRAHNEFSFKNRLDSFEKLFK